MSNYSSSNYQPENPNSSWYKVYNMIDPNSSVLDIGCSSGNFGEALIKNKNCTVDGIELDQKDAAEAQKKLRKVYNMNIETGSLDDMKEKYDYIYLGDVIEHLLNPSQALIRIKGLLKNNGKILFSIPNMAHVSLRLMLLKGDFEYGETGLLDNTHLHFYTLREIERVFQEAGYSISLLDSNEATYPPELIADQLKELGIHKTPKLEKLLNSDEARVFQYVGTAVMGSTHKISRKQYSPDPQGTISLWYQGHLQARDRELEVLRNQLDEQAKIIENQAGVLSNDAELARRIRIRRYLKFYILNKARALKQYWQHKV